MLESIYLGLTGTNTAKGTCLCGPLHREILIQTALSQITSSLPLHWRSRTEPCTKWKRNRKVKLWWICFCLKCQQPITSPCPEQT